jgi:FlaA1/EpsC-like NDP-sugar epimerase
VSPLPHSESRGTGPVEPGYRRWLPLIHFGADAASTMLALVAAWWLRYDFSFGYESAREFAVDLVLLCLVSVFLLGIVGYLTGLYRRQWRYGSFDESIALAATISVTGASTTLLVIGFDFGFTPRTVPAIATSFALFFSITGRSVWRLWRIRSLIPVGAEPLVVVGAGEAGAQIVGQLLMDRTGTYIPVALVDDDPNKSRLRVQGVPVKGGIDDLARVMAESNARTVLVAIPSASQALLRRVARLTTESNMRVLTLPRVDQMLAAPDLADIRPITEEDLLGRAPSDIDTTVIAGYVTGRRVLVTGAGGSIGSELCRQLASFRPAQLVMVDRDESGLHSTQLSIAGHGLLDDPNLVLADLRDPEMISSIFDTHRPEVVFHAAALKHLPLLESHPEEAWKSNVVMTRLLLEAANHAGVSVFVNISTDKAADPTSVLGCSKRIAERLTADLDQHGSGRFISVRFGNVLGSRGSVLTAFAAQAAKGGPLTVTDPDVTRYFMTIEEAVQLTIYAGAIGGGGDVLVLDMGDPVRIIDVANRFAARHEPPLRISITGLRPGEKLHEVLFGSDETHRTKVHPLIDSVPVLPLEWPSCRQVWEDMVLVRQVR